ncbi:spindle and kinetochore-associated protein 3 isoform X1 [Hippoglossus stenolepis]|uniref:spindle and kinetochore-associated protein 3 isoform X1 n=1 Tax=Hippoglossus stenolepis TaxID=195615 RepID=UPI00159BFD60|nr:spindle and kinetochore-associated protein 3 isoform X1 [Hippoglossus stenolepis]
MEPTERFFSRLRKLAVTLESETTKLQESFDNREKNEVDSETTAKAMRAYHELNGDVGNLKGQVQDQMTQHKAQENEVSSFIKACRVMEQRVSQDIQTLKEHWENYGYEAPRDAQRRTKDNHQDSDTEELADESETKSAEEEEGSQEEAGDDQASSSRTMGPPPFTDVMRTPQLSDFGLSEILLKRGLAGREWCSEVPPMPEIRLTHPSLSTPTPPPMPITPKRALRMDDTELQSPQMHNFGISEHTMCLYNDFTMNLIQKNIDKPQRSSQDKPVPPLESLKESLQTKAENLESPELPVFCTQGFKIKKTNKPTANCSPAASGRGDPESPTRLGPLCTTPEVPAFQTPYLSRLVSTKKSAKQPEPISMQTDDDGHSSKPLTPTHSTATGSKRMWEYNVPEISIMGEEDKQMPEMPNLESCLGKSLQNRSAKIPRKTGVHEQVTEEFAVNSLELDEPTQEFSLGTPRIRRDYQEPSTPEMPDLSSVTQDICKLVSQSQLKKTEVAVVQPNVRTQKHKNSAPSLSAVSESEFQSLPRYMRQMTLSNLNQVVHNINKFTAEFPGEKTELNLEELKRITNVGTKTPVFVLCLTELKRLQQVGGAKNNAVYKLSANT